ncbi:MAG: NADH-quinone oxidoreductase subunit L [bacterium]
MKIFKQEEKGLFPLLFTIIAFIGSLFLISPSMSGKYPVIQLKLTDWLNLNFTFDSLAVFMALCSSFIGALIVFYSFGYMKDSTPGRDVPYRHLGEYYSFIALFIGSMLGLIFSTNLLLMYIFWEITTICSWRLIGFYREKQHLANADKAFYITFFGSAMMLIGMEIIYQQFGTLNLTQLRGAPVDNLALLLILLGILSKSAQLPFQIWLPTAGVAPSPVTALLHAAVLVKIGVYAFARIFCWTFHTPIPWSNIVPVIAVIGAFVSACCALVENDMKRILAYSTISQIAYILLGLSLNTTVGITGGLLFILVHGLGKAGLFLCAGVVEHETKEKDIRKLGGMFKTMPIAGISFILCALSIMGIPPFGGFWSKLFIITATVQSGHFIIAGVAIITAILTMVYLIRFFNKVFMGEPTNPSCREKSFPMLFTVMTLGILGLVVGCFVKLPLNLIRTAVEQMK